MLIPYLSRYDIDQSGPSLDQGGTVDGQESTEPQLKAESQTNAVDVEGGQGVFPWN